jgi:hypothetical protein
MLEAIENTAFATFVRESPSLFGYTAVLSLHAIGLAIVVGVSTVVALRLLGYASEMPLRPVARLYPLMYTGFWVNALSGLALLMANATGMLTMVMFYIKMAFIVAAVVLLAKIRNTVFADEALSADVVDGSRQRRLAGALIGCWIGAIIAGRLTGYPYFVADWFGI